MTPIYSKSLYSVIFIALFSHVTRITFQETEVNGDSPASHSSCSTVMGVQPAQEVSGRIQGQGSMIYRPIVALPSGLHYSIEVGLEFDALEKGSEVVHTVQAAVRYQSLINLSIKEDFQTCGRSFESLF